MRRTAIASMVFAAAVLFLPAAARSACTDQAAVDATRAAADAACDCAGAATHGAYVRCVAGVAKAAADAGTLPRNCKGSVVRCAAKSTCGKPDFVTCCRTNARGKQTCSVKRDPSACKPPRNGTACVGQAASCCDACPPGVCDGSPSGAFLAP
jgi:hypothetical protein